MIRLLFLSLILMSSFAFAQTSSEKPQAIKVEEFGKLYNGDMKARFDYFFSEVNNTPASKGLIVIYGTGRESARLEKFFKNYARFRGVDLSKLEVIKAGYRSELMTQFWNVPVGAENPKLEPTARKFDEFGQTTPGDIKARIDALFAELKKKKDLQGYIFNYGTARQIAVREKLIRNVIPFRQYDAIRITIINGGKGIGLKTILWIVPEGAEVPKP